MTMTLDETLNELIDANLTVVGLAISFPIGSKEEKALALASKALNKYQEFLIDVQRERETKSGVKRNDT